jgi:hypothetical protein
MKGNQVLYFRVIYSPGSDNLSRPSTVSAEVNSQLNSVQFNQVHHNFE